MNRFTLILFVLLAGCATDGLDAEDRAANKRADYINGLAYKCKEFGVARTDQRFPECMMRLDAMEQQRRAQADAMLFGLATQANQLGQPRFIPQSTIRCTSDMLGGFICR